MKIIFLDIDGVLNNRGFICRPERNRHLPDLENMADMIDPIMVERLNHILDASGASVVVSSSWRIGETNANLRWILNSRGFKGQIIGKTRSPHGPNFDRDSEIQAWLDEHNDVESFVILDDGEIFSLLDHQVLTSFEVGLLDEHIEKALKILNK